MAYPFIQFPSYSEFVDRLRDQNGIVLKTLDSPVIRENDEPMAVHFLEGIVNGQTVTYALDIQDFQERLAPSVLRSICARFDLDAESFGSARTSTSQASETDFPA